MRVSDASIFSRALTTIEIKEIEKLFIKDEKEVIIGRLTSMNGELIKYANPKLIPSPNRLPSGKILEEDKKNSSYSIYKVAPGATFEELISELKKSSVVPVLFPFYLQGTVGGFIATNGSGFGSYKFGFVKDKKEVHSLNGNVAYIMAANYSEVIESEKESKFAWSGLIIDDKEIYYLPTPYAKLEGLSGGSIDTYTLISDLNKKITQSFKRDYFPVMLRFPYASYSKINQIKNFEKILGYIINFNSPEKYYVILGSIKYDDLDDLALFLKKNKEVLPFPSLSNYDKLHLEILNKVGKKVKVPRDFRNVSNLYVESMKCINCGLCLNVCKAFNTTHNPLYSPVGKFGRLIFEEKQYEACFGCVKDEEVCPVNIPISKITTEMVNTISPEPVKIDLQPLPSDINQMAKKLQETYRNKPLFLLFVGCSSKYDMDGIRGFLNYLMDKGNQLPNSMSPKVELINDCCGFDDFIGGNLEGAKTKVNKILEQKRNKGALGIYFLCPEALYVYNNLSGDKGILGYEVVKQDIKGKVHAGCWAKKLGIKGDDDECAGLNFTTYKGAPISYKRKDVLTICPFSTWKYGTASIYASFYKGIQVLKTAEEYKDIDKILLDIATESIIEALATSSDEIAEKVGLWNLGGRGYFELVAYPIVGNKFKNIFEDKIKNNERKDEIVKYLTTVVNEPALLESKTSLITDYVKGLDLSSQLRELKEKIANSPRLEYSARNVAETEEMVNALSNILKKAISPKLVERIFKEIVYS